MKPWDTFTAAQRKYLEVVAGVALPAAWVKWTTYIEEKNGIKKRLPRYPRATPSQVVEIVREIAQRSVVR